MQIRRYLSKRESKETMPRVGGTAAGVGAISPLCSALIAERKLNIRSSGGTASGVDALTAHHNALIADRKLNMPSASGGQFQDSWTFIP